MSPRKTPPVGSRGGSEIAGRALSQSTVDGRHDRSREAALDLAAAGWAVFPLRGKVPAVPGGRGVLDATSDPQVIKFWWTQYGGANIGARVPGGLLVVDVDPRHGGDAALQELCCSNNTSIGTLTETLTVWSGRGDGGRHLYFRHPGGAVTGRRLPAGVDLKTHTGYCVVPPSVHPATGQPYTWEHRPIAVLPAWLRTLLRPVAAAPRHEPARAAGSGGALVRFVDGLTEGHRNRGLFWACCRAVEAGDEALLKEISDAAHRAGLTPAEVRATVTSARNRTGAGHAATA